jgi:hypothetical protein
MAKAKAKQVQVQVQGARGQERRNAGTQERSTATDIRHEARSKKQASIYCKKQEGRAPKTKEEMEKQARVYKTEWGACSSCEL